MATSTKKKDANEGKLVVLTNLFVARTGAKGTGTRRYRRGQVFDPVDGVHDVDNLIAAKIIGKVKNGKAPVATTARTMSQAAAKLNGEESPVLSLQSQPFEVAKAPKKAKEADDGDDGDGTGADAGTAGTPAGAGADTK